MRLKQMREPRHDPQRRRDLHHPVLHLQLQRLGEWKDSAMSETQPITAQRLLDQKITDQTRYVWHPAVEPERLRDWAYETDESNSADLHSLEGSPR